MPAHVAFAFAFLPMSVLATSLGATATDALTGIAIVAVLAGAARGGEMGLR